MKTTVAMVAEMLQGLASRWYVKLVISVLTFLFTEDKNTHLMFEALAVLMVVDLLTGLWAAAKAKQLSSRVGVLSTLTKFGIYAAIVVSARMLELIVTAAGVPVVGVTVKVAIVYLAAQEAISINENTKAVNGVGLAGILNALKGFSGPQT